MMLEQKPDILYHYTTLDGLKGIFNDKSLWATKIQYLNDASELTKPLAIANEILANSINEPKGDHFDRFKAIRTMIKDIKSWSGVNLCVSSLCTNGDLLSQWRGYGAYGSAYSIGFNVKILEEMLKITKFELCRCDYFDEKKYYGEIQKFILDTIEQRITSDAV